jgi:hypothetical protein
VADINLFWHQYFQRGCFRLTDFYTTWKIITLVDNIKTHNFKEITLEDLNWIYLAQ